MCLMTFSVFQADASVSSKQHFRLLPDEENSEYYHTEAIVIINKLIISLVCDNSRVLLLYWGLLFINRQVCLGNIRSETIFNPEEGS